MQHLKLFLESKPSYLIIIIIFTHFNIINDREGYQRLSLSRVFARSQMLLMERTGQATTLGTLSPTLCDESEGSLTSHGFVDTEVL